MKREVEQILERDESRTPVTRFAPPRRGVRQLSGWLRLTPGILMLGALLLTLIGLAVQDYRTQFVLAALGLFAAGYMWSMQRRSGRARPAPGGVRRVPGRNSREVYWRGERVDTIRPRRAQGDVVRFRGGWRARLRRRFRGK